MVEIQELKSMSPDCIQTLAELHKKAFPGFFLTQLGIPLLRALYKEYMENQNSGIIVAVEESRILGFIAYSKDYSEFYKSLIKHHMMKFAFCSIGAVVRHPSLIKHLLSVFSKSESVAKTEAYVELASICVDPENANRGIGTQLIDYLKGFVDFSRFSYINLETDAVENVAANKFYLKNGFILAREYTTSEGRRMNEYRFTPGEK